MKLSFFKTVFVAAGILFTTVAAQAANFNIPGGSLKAALNAYASQTGVPLVYLDQELDSARSKGVKGDLSNYDALSQILAGTGFVAQRHPSGSVGIVHATSSDAPVLLKEAATPAVSVSGAPLETVTVTSSKIGGDVQNIPISITALSQEQLTQTQTAGGPDLVKQVPNLTFTKTNFTGYSIQIRGIGTQAISVSTDPAVAVAFNDIPFIRNHFFEQEFYDVSQVEVLRGPQGTLYGRNATAGVVNMVSAKPTDQYEAMASVDVGNYNNRRLEGMLNVPIVGDKLDVRVAGEWTKRDGYTYDTTLQQSVDGRNLWSGRASVEIRPFEHLEATAIWEHFSENDDRLRSAKTLCHTDPGPSSVDGPAGLVTNIDESGDAWLSQGCKPGSLYGPGAFGVPNPGAITFVQAAEYTNPFIPTGSNPYGTLSQSQNLRVIGSALKPSYRAKNDTLEFNADYAITPSLTLTSQTGYNKDFLYSTEDFNRFNTVPNEFVVGGGQALTGQDGEFCDPQLGCSTRFLAEDVSQQHSEQFYQEVRLASSFTGPLNFSAGGSFLHYHTLEDYYVFSNVLTAYQEDENQTGFGGPNVHATFDAAAANACGPVPATNDPNFIFTYTAAFGLGCAWIDPNPLSKIDGQGHNYFRSENPYRLHSWAGFGEAYYQVAPDLKLTGGLRWTDDMKSFTEYPSWTLIVGKGYPSFGDIDQQWKEWTGRFVANWTPKLDFTDQSLFYGSYSRGYKGGGANPPGVVPLNLYGLQLSSPSVYDHPLTFAPEFVNAFELGTKNTLLDGAMTLNGDVFYYDYKGYQISEIVDRTAINLNFNATVKGAELESTWEPIPGLRFNFAGGYENTRIDNGQQAIDLMDRTAGNSDWMVVRPFLTETSSCILPTYVVNELISSYRASRGGSNSIPASAVPANNPPGGGPTFGLYADGDYGALNAACFAAYSLGVDPGNSGFDPSTAPHNGEGFDKNLGGNKLPNAPPFTLSLGAQYTMPLSADWAATGRADGYWQGNSFARVFNDKPYDQLHGYTNLNLTLIFTNQDGWQAMAYMKNVFNTTTITGAFLNSDDTGLSTNIFTTDPRLFGLRITKNW
ncbi:MAG TPA: TonB-dependent receptor [Rhizomicrobium sp.]|nr:TonB-dependent receptor [Rhizomicrobium sp.]